MKKMLAIFFSVFLFSLVLGGQANAAFFKSGDEVLIDTEIGDDLYIAGGMVSIQNDVQGDLVAAGRSVIIDADIADDVIVAGGKVEILGNVGGDVRVVGGQVSIFGNVEEDVIVSGGSVNLESSSHIGGDVIFSGMLVSLNSLIGKNVFGSGLNISIAGEVDGNVNLKTQARLIVAKSAAVNGDFVYYSTHEADIEPGQVGGEIVYNELLQDERRIVSAGGWSQFFVEGYSILKLWSFFSMLLVGIIFMSFVRRSFMEVAEIMEKSFLKNLGIGFLLIVLFFPFMLFMLVTLVGIPLGLISLYLALILLYLVKVYAGYFLGRVLFYKQKNPTKSFDMLTLAVGLLFYYLLVMVPVIGQFIMIVFFVTALGALASFAAGLCKYLHAKKKL